MNNPYQTSKAQGKTVLIQGRVSVEDQLFIKRLLPFAHGKFDAIVGTLFHAFVQELRRLEQENGVPFEPGILPDEPTYFIVENVLSRCNFAVLPPSQTTEHS